MVSLLSNNIDHIEIQLFIEIKYILVLSFLLKSEFKRLLARAEKMSKFEYFGSVCFRNMQYACLYNVEKS